MPTKKFLDANGVTRLKQDQLATLQTAVEIIDEAKLDKTDIDSAAFYGLAEAAGDTTQASSENNIGTYTANAQSAIQAMLGVSGIITQTVTGTDPVITAQENYRYICGTVLTLSFTPSVTGICDVFFTSGSTPTVLTLPNTVKMPEWFEIETNRTYEISILNGVYGAVMSWVI